MSGSYSEQSMETLEFDECECDDPAADPMRYELPDGSAIELVACDKCCGMVEWDRSASHPDPTPEERQEIWERSVEKFAIRNPDLADKLRGVTK